MTYLGNKFQLIHPRWAIFSRVCAAIFGGYALATSSSVFIGQLLLTSIGKYQAIHLGLLLSFLVYACAVMWVFSVASVKKAWWLLILVNITLILASWLLTLANGAIF